MNSVQQALERRIKLDRRKETRSNYGEYQEWRGKTIRIRKRKKREYEEEIRRN
jgi:hypothetical protein